MRLFILFQLPFLSWQVMGLANPISPEPLKTLHAHPHLSCVRAFEPRVEAMPDFEIQIAEDDSFASIVASDSIAAVITRYVPADPLLPGSYYWRVRTRQADGTTDDWSSPKGFEVVLPENVITVPASATGAEIQQLLERATQQSPCVIRFSGKEYRVKPGESALIDLQGAHDLIIDGAGASIVLTGPGSFMRLRDSTNIHLKGFEIDYEKMPHTAGRVTAIDRKTGTIDLELLEGYPTFEEAPAIASYPGGMIRTGKHHAMKNNVPLVVTTDPDPVYLEGRTYRLRPASPRQDFASFALGDIYAKGPRGPAGFDLEDCEDIAISDCRMYLCSGIGFSTHAVERLRILNFQFKRKPGRPIVVQNGGHNHHDARIGPWVENCLFENTGDDFCHVNGLVRGIKEVIGPSELILHGSSLAIEVGDVLQFYDKNAAHLISERKVVSIDVRRRETTVTLDGDTGPVEVDENGGRHLYQGTQVFNRNRQCGQFVWRNNRCLRGRRIGVLCKGAGGLIEKNHFQQLGGGAVEIWNSPFEGLYADGYVIRDNQMIECGLVAGKGDSRTIWVFNRYGTPRLHRNLLIENNLIRDYPCRAMIIRSTENVVIRGNRIINEKFPEFRNTPGAIDIDHCSGIVEERNLIQDRRLPLQLKNSTEKTREGQDSFDRPSGG